MKGIAATLVGDGIETPGNALTLIHAAQMYGAVCSFRDTKGLNQSEYLSSELAGQLSVTSSSQIAEKHARIIAFDNLADPQEVYGFEAGKDFAIVVGNERRGLSHEFLSLATGVVQIPMLSRRINTLNVAAAAGVALHYLGRRKVGRMATRRNPAKRRPELLLIGAGDHIELGSAIRSAMAFGWSRALVDDRQHVWFGVDRGTRSEGRAAARRGRNRIRLISSSKETEHGFPEVVVITKSRFGVPLHQIALNRGSRQVVVIPDESGIRLDNEVRERYGSQVRFAQLDTPVGNLTYHYRLLATVAMAEISRQVGRSRPGVRKPPPPAPSYDRSLELRSGEVGEDVWFEDLVDY